MAKHYEMKFVALLFFIFSSVVVVVILQWPWTVACASMMWGSSTSRGSSR